VEGAPYTHVGIVIRDGTNLWSWDAPGGGDTLPDPISKNPNQTGARVADGTPFPGANFKLPEPWNLGVGVGASWALATTVHATVAGTFFCAQLAAQSYMAMGKLPIRPRRSR
jgi:hypothetical protein